MMRYKTESHMGNLVALLEQDDDRMKILSIVRELELPDCYVAAGFVRNLVWDSLHSTSTELNDIDVVFYDRSDSKNRLGAEVSQRLNREYPEFLWEAKNQAYMHIRNGDTAYKDTLDAMKYWPEKETGVGASLNSDNSISIISAYGLETLFDGKVTHNKKRSMDIFKTRVHKKRWLETWPELQIVL